MVAKLKRVGRFLIFFASISAPSYGQEKPGPWSGFHLYEENDTLVPPKVSSDEGYTQGLRLVLTRRETWGFAQELRDKLSGEHDYGVTNSMFFGQYMFTPRNITTFEIAPDDRPYAGLLYGGVNVNLLYTADPKVYRQHSFEALAGFIGPYALAGAAQAGLHAVRQHRIPKGWGHQKENEFVLNFRYARDLLRVIKAGSRDITGRYGASLGTVQTYVTAGATVRFGKNLSGIPGSILTNSATRDLARTPEPKEYGIFAGIDGRAFARNAYYDKGITGRGPSIEKNWGVYDLLAGFFVRRGEWTFTYNFVSRSPEFKGRSANGRHRFGSIALSREYGTDIVAPSCRCLNWLKDTAFQLGIGRSLSRTTLGGRQGQAISGPSGRLVLTKGVTSRLTVGLETVGGTQEGGPPDSTRTHRDTLLKSSVMTLGIRPLGAWSGSTTLHIRAGFGSAVVKDERTTNTANPRDESRFLEKTEKGQSFLVGASYLFNFTNHLALGLDTTWSRLKGKSTIIDRASFWSTTVAVRLSIPRRHPSQPQETRQSLNDLN